MSAESVPTSTTARLRNLYEEYTDVMAQLVEMDEFTIDDVNADHKDYLRVVNALKAKTAIRQSGTHHRGRGESGKDTVARWTWHSGAHAKLQAYLDQRSELPCEHRAHVHHHDGRYGCQYCDEPRDFDREKVEQAVFGQ